jgi:hypothetical protein
MTEKDAVKCGDTTRAWKKTVAKTGSRTRMPPHWTKEHCKSFYGYKKHVNTDANHKLIRAMGSPTRQFTTARSWMG